MHPVGKGMGSPKVGGVAGSAHPTMHASGNGMGLRRSKPES